MRRFLPLILVGLIASGVVAWAAAPGLINQYNALCGANTPTYCAQPDSSGNLPVTGTISGTVSVGATATAAAPAYVEATSNPFSQNLTGDLRTIAKQSTSPWIVAGAGTAGAPGTAVLTVQGVASGTAQPVSVASGGIASGAVSSGAIASGAYASGSIGSGAIASGAIASGAVASGAVASGAYASGSVSDGAVVTLGAKADAKSTATDTTSITVMQVLKEISFMEQTPAALPANQSVNLAQVAGATTAVDNGIHSTGAARVTIADQGVGEYEAVAASATAQVLGATGGTGDYLLQLVCAPATTSPGVVTVLDNATALVSFAGGASSVSNLLPFTIPVNAYSTSGAWKVTTGANVSCVGVGNFT